MVSVSLSIRLLSPREVRRVYHGGEKHQFDSSKSIHGFILWPEPIAVGVHSPKTMHAKQFNPTRRKREFTISVSVSVALKVLKFFCNNIFLTTLARRRLPIFWPLLRRGVFGAFLAQNVAGSKKRSMMRSSITPFCHSQPTITSKLHKAQICPGIPVQESRCLKLKH